MDPFGADDAGMTFPEEDETMGLAKNVVDGLYKELERLDGTLNSIALKMQSHKYVLLIYVFTK